MSNNTTAHIIRPLGKFASLFQGTTPPYEDQVCILQMYQQQLTHKLQCIPKPKVQQANSEVL
jgi:hypothetical protein